MNGEMSQACRIVIAARKAMKDKKQIVFEPLIYEMNIMFEFLPRKTLFFSKSSKANCVMDWFDQCLSLGIEDIKFLTPISAKDRGLLGFSNTTPSSLLCFYKNRVVTYFSVNWSFDNVLKGWNITYTEHSWDNAPKEKPKFENNTEEFVSVLNDIEELARSIDCDDFADIFHIAGSILKGKTDEDSDFTNLLPPGNTHLFAAASKADVFGAMGSWNDSPPYMAKEKGLDKQYQELSDNLLRQLRLAVLYAVNEW